MLVAGALVLFMPCVVFAQARMTAADLQGSVCDASGAAFNLFNRVNFVEDTNQSSFVIFGSGAYPANPLPAYGHYTLTMPPRQVQLAMRVSF